MQRDRLMAYQPWGQVFRSVACGLGCELLDATVFDAGIAAEPASLDNRLRLRRLLCSDCHSAVRAAPDDIQRRTIFSFFSPLLLI